MFFSDKELDTLDVLSTLRKQVELLDSHKAINLIKDKQYAESLESIMKKIEELEKEYGIEEKTNGINDSFDKINETLTKIQTTLNELSRDLQRKLDENNYSEKRLF